MRITFEVRKRTGLAYANLLRTVIIETSQSIKPIGIAFKDGSNTFVPSENLVEVLGFCQKLSDLDYVDDGSLNFPLVVNYSFKGTLMSSQLSTENLKVVEGDVRLLDTIDKTKEISFSVIYSKGSGKRSSEDNKQIIESFNNFGTFRALSSRYSDSKVSFDVKEDLENDVVIMDISCKSGNEELKIREAISSIVDSFSKIS